MQPTQPGVVVTLAGEIDLGVRAEMRARLAEAAGEAVRCGTGLIVDLDGVTFMDAAGLGEVIAAREALRARGCTLVVRNVHGSVARLFDVTGLRHLCADVV